MVYLWVGLAGGLGAVLRLLVYRLTLVTGTTAWPLATLLVNVLGSFLIGLLIVLCQQRWTVSEELKLAITTGLLGGFTTFSAFSLETVQMLERGEVVRPAFYVLSTVMLSLLACWFGLVAARLMVR